jgi:uncharacterized protein
MAEVVSVGLEPASGASAVEAVLPAIAALLGRAERVALIRYLHQASSRSKARRLISQVGQQGWRIWSQLRAGRGKHEKAS